VALEILKNIENIGIIEFNEADIVRHKLVKDIVRAYEKWQNKKQ
jgi:phosphate starvation-inducible PhoH-like protein